MSTVAVYVEHRDGQVRPITHEALTAAKSLGGKVVAIAVGNGISTDIANGLGDFGAEEVLIANSDALADFSVQGAAEAFAQAAKEAGAEVIIVGGSNAEGKDVGPRIAAKLDAAFAAGVTAVSGDTSNTQVTRPIYSGKAIATVALTGSPKVIVLRPKAVSAAGGAGAAGAAKEVSVNVDAAAIKAKVTAVEAAAGGKQDLTEADIIVSGGRGMKGPENYNILEDLAGKLGGVVGASRASVDSGWRPHSDQVGQTGKTVTPTVYIACGISGAIQHLAGMSNSKHIIAINKDGDAPIFEIASLGLVGDLFEVVPKVTEKVG